MSSQTVRPGPDRAKVRDLLDRLGVEVADLRRLAVTGPGVLNLRAPHSYADAFAVLGEAGVLSADLVEELAPMAGFRNLLVHGYAQVDDARVETIPNTRVGDLERFAAAVAAAVLAGGDPARP